MHRFSRFVVGVALVALVASPALAQRGPRGGMRGGFSSFMLLGQKSVQEELKLSADQLKKVSETQAKLREEGKGLRELQAQERRKKMQELRKKGDEAVAKILEPKQTKRLKQISWQRQGVRALGNPEIAKELQITDDQKKQMKTIGEESRTEMRKIFQGEGTREEKGKKFAELRKSGQTKIEKLLTDDQKAKWKELLGEPFKGKIEFRFSGRRGRAR